MNYVGSNQHVTKTGGRQAPDPAVRQARGERLKALRLSRKMTQDDVALAGSFPRADMSRFEKGEKLSSQANRKKLAVAFNMTIDRLSAVLDGTEVTFSDRIYETVAHVAKLRGFSEQEVQAASSLMFGLDGFVLTEEGAYELLKRARTLRHDLEQRFTTPIADTGGSALDDLRGGKSSMKKR